MNQIAPVYLYSITVHDRSSGRTNNMAQTVLSEANVVLDLTALQAQKYAHRHSHMKVGPQYMHII